MSLRVKNEAQIYRLAAEPKGTHILEKPCETERPTLHHRQTRVSAKWQQPMTLQQHNEFIFKVRNSTVDAQSKQPSITKMRVSQMWKSSPPNTIRKTYKCFYGTVGLHIIRNGSLGHFTAGKV